jgi:hypothetical protein
VLITHMNLEESCLLELTLMHVRGRLSGSVVALVAYYSEYSSTGVVATYSSTTS